VYLALFPLCQVILIVRFIFRRDGQEELEAECGVELIIFALNVPLLFMKRWIRLSLNVSFAGNVKIAFCL
jgi:hypothetical protein